MLFYLLLSLFFFIVYFLPVKLEIYYRRREDKDDFKLRLKVLFVNQKLKLSFVDVRRFFFLPTAKLRGELKSILFDKEVKIKEVVNEEELDYLIERMRQVYRIAKRFRLFFLLSHNCSFFLWKTSFGLKNPAYTGMVTGLLWSVKSSMIATIQNHSEFKKLPIIDVKANFNHQEPIKIEFKGIFNFRLGKIILMGARVSLSQIKRRIERKWTTIRLKD